MSHFTVLAKVTPERLAMHNGELQSAVEEMMAPYQENNMGDCPRQFLEFNDVEDEYRQKWETETDTAVRLADGRVVCRYDDECYRDPTPEELKEHGPMFGTGFGGGISYASKDWGDGRGYRAKVLFLPEGAVEFERPLKERFPDFAVYMESYCGYSIDSETGKYGYWKNPNAKWDYFRIGGRWRGKMRVRECAASAAVGPKAWELKEGFGKEEEPDQPHTADVAKVCDVDFEGMSLEVDLKIEEFWAKCERAKMLGVFDPNMSKEEKAAAQQNLPSEDSFLGWDTHRTLWDLGLRHREGHDAPFACKDFTLEDLKRDYRWYWEFQTFAVVDDEGWHGKGEMGWWACSSDNADDRKVWGSTFAERFLKNENPETTLVVLDCHI